MRSLLCEESMGYFLLWPWPLVPRRSKVDNSGPSCQLNGCSLSDFPEQSIPVKVSSEKGKSYRENLALFAKNYFFAFCLHAKNPKISPSFFCAINCCSCTQKMRKFPQVFLRKIIFCILFAREKCKNVQNFRSLKTLILIVGQKVITPNNKCKIL